MSSLAFTDSLVRAHHGYWVRYFVLFRFVLCARSRSILTFHVFVRYHSSIVSVYTFFVCGEIGYIFPVLGVSRFVGGVVCDDDVVAAQLCYRAAKRPVSNP